jgi:hypothetical protein
LMSRLTENRDRSPLLLWPDFRIRLQQLEAVDGLTI